jgi:hypothetical protein
MRWFGIIRALRGMRGVGRRAGSGSLALPERRRERGPFPSSASRRGFRSGGSRPVRVEPEGDHRLIDAMMEQVHRGAVAKRMWRDPLCSDVRASAQCGGRDPASAHQPPQLPREMTVGPDRPRRIVGCGKALRERVQIRIDAGLPIIGHDRGAPCCWSSEGYVGGAPVEHPRHGSTDETGTVLDQARSNSWMVTICWSVFDPLLPFSVLSWLCQIGHTS